MPKRKAGEVKADDAPGADGLVDGVRRRQAGERALSLSLREKQSAFAHSLGRLISFVYAKGWELTFGDGSILPKGPDGKGRKARHLVTGLTLRVEDAVHMRGSLHYCGLAQDVNLFIAGQWIADGAHPAWKELGAYWKGLHELARWGGDFGDANHFSFTHDGKA